MILISLFTAGNAFAIETELGDVHGFLSQGYLKSDDNNYYADTEDGTFHFREMGINLSGWITSGLRGGIQFVLTDLGDTGNNEVYVDWAYLDYHWQPWLGARAGRINSANNTNGEYSCIYALTVSTD